MSNTSRRFLLLLMFFVCLFLRSSFSSFCLLCLVLCLILSFFSCLFSRFVFLLKMRVFAEKLQKYDITLASNQFEFSLVNQDKDEDGTLAECKRLGQCRNGSEDGKDTTVELPPPPRPPTLRNTVSTKVLQNYYCMIVNPGSWKRWMTWPGHARGSAVPASSALEHTQH